MSGQVTVSVVLYNHHQDEIASLFAALAKDPMISRWATIDNGGAREACRFAHSLGAHCLDPGRNLGFGAAHNLALRELAPLGRYHLFINPDIQMENGVLSELVGFMDQHPDVGLVMPSILYPDGSQQRLCKRLPTPFDLFLRRFLGRFGKSVFRARMNAYEMRDMDLTVIREVPSLSGCFMLVRTSALQEIGAFDERYFLYLEDFDLCRRIGEKYRTVYFPDVAVHHGYAKGSYRNIRLLRLHLTSAIRYFNKWGWFSDPGRARLNQRTATISEWEISGQNGASSIIRDGIS